MARCRLHDNVSPPPSPPSVNGGALPQHYGHDDLNGGDQPAKISRYAEDHGDCINRLPDDVLIGIISRLPIRAAVATGAVSARWRHLWKHVPTISLRPRHIGLPPGAGSESERDAWRIAGAASSVLRHHRGAGVDKLVLALPLSPSTHAAVLDQAMEFAASARALELHLSLAGSIPPPHYDFPHRRFAGGRLHRLRLCNVRLRSLESLARLTHLDLTRVAVDDAGVAGVLAACAALTILELNECRQLVHVAASHGSLHVLSVRPRLRRPEERRRRIQQPARARLPRPQGLHRVPARASHPQARALHDQRVPARLHAWRRAATQWREHVASVASLLVAAPSVKELHVEAYSDLPVPPPNKQAIQWPERCSPKKLQSIAIGGFSGEPELMDLAFFLLQRSPAIRTLTIDTHRRHVNGRGWRREEAEDTLRCYYARGVVVPKIPYTVKFTII
ncbi:unnamed protein product [Urochloa decumbens]|uniref:F-box domain-containing protein n=1 Tax=Urochloa decumbens TaxID=240449 RepID=A0ABC8XRC2_9POAL